MITIYKSFDDREFTTKEECELYEEAFRKKMETIGLEFYDCEGKSMPITPKSLHECSYIYVKTFEALDLLIEFGDSIETVIPEDLGLWYWDYSEWVSLKECLRPWMNIYTVVQKAMADLKES